MNDDPKDDNNIIDFSKASESKRVTEAQEKLWREKYRGRKQQEQPRFGFKTLFPSNDVPAEGDGASQPFINLPIGTKIMLGLIVGFYLLFHFALGPAQQDWAFMHFSFIPAAWTGDINLPLWVYIISPFSFNFLHGSTLHLIMNSVMFLAFGAGVERMLGAKRMVILFFAGSFLALCAHFLFNAQSTAPLIGASGGLSAMFGAILYIYAKQGLMGNGKYGLWPIIVFFVVISILFGLMGSPDGSGEIAWIAHIAGFLAGFVLVKPIVRLKI